MDLLQRAAHVFAGTWSQQSISVGVSDGMPTWWNPGVHDGELVNGILEYGYGAWTAIQEDPRCTFQKASLGEWRLPHTLPDVRLDALALAPPRT
jgi:hypothetical protein